MGTTHNAKIPLAFFYFCLRKVNALPKMNILRLTLILILLQTHGFGQPLSGQVFILADDFSEEKCEAFGECDCCTSDIFFLSSDKFCYISRCISGDSYFTGAYSTDSSKLKLTFDKKYVVEITDEDYTVTKLETRTTEIKPAEFDITKCGQSLRLNHSTIREWRNGSRYSKLKETEMMKQLTMSKAWKQISK
jgi:hypothetical protein